MILRAGVFIVTTIPSFSKGKGTGSTQLCHSPQLRKFHDGGHHLVMGPHPEQTKIHEKPEHCEGKTPAVFFFIGFFLRLRGVFPTLCVNAIDITTVVPTSLQV